MYKQKLGMSVSYDGLPITDLVNLLAKIGFDAISPVWHSEYLEKSVLSAKENGLQLQSLHAPFSEIENMWSIDTNLSNSALNELNIALEDCNKYEIPIMVCHIWKGFDNLGTPTYAGIENFGKLINKAKEYGIKIAFENTEGEDYLYYLMENFKGDDTVGFCWDSGHEMCYNDCSLSKR